MATSTGFNRTRAAADFRPWSKSAASLTACTARSSITRFKSGITIAASLHGLAAVPHGEVFEYCMAESPLRHDLTHEKFAVVDGYVHVPEGPGLGVTINEDIVERYLVP